ncbi:MAG: glutamate--tRNA ligase [Caedibacter sp. 38-128]|nr:glutamate--tRNA ligase [Holosporales bacterium]OJX07020.1 MAG: glutamate--tRNA ligase [Caedibacter sp. 38-128]
MSTPILRFAPSPTGLLHIGNARTALINWLFARKNKATFILRLDDTDLARSEQQYEQAIYEDLKWLGLSYDRIEWQSKRLREYEKAADALKASGRLYACYETPEELEFKRRRLLSQGRPPIYDRAALNLTPEEHAHFLKEGRKPHWRFKLMSEAISWKDLIRGEISFEGENLSDPILIREDNSPVYTLSSVVDDIDFGITHVIRGEDHITNTAIQLQLIEALGADSKSFTFGHVQYLLGEQGESLSKRIGSLSLRQLREEGYEACALASYLAKLGTSEDISPALSLDQLISEFDISHVGRAAPRFSKNMLDRMNARLLHHQSYNHAQARLAEEGLHYIHEEFWNMCHGNINKLMDLKHIWNICTQELAPKIEDASYLEEACRSLPFEPWSSETWVIWTQALKEKTGRKGKDLFMPLRQALTGEDHGPEMKELLPLIGREKALKRLQGKVA